jgi:hypothetical protein
VLEIRLVDRPSLQASQHGRTALFALVTAYLSGGCGGKVTEAEAAAGSPARSLGGNTPAGGNTAGLSSGGTVSRSPAPSGGVSSSVTNDQGPLVPDEFGLIPLEALPSPIDVYSLMTRACAAFEETTEPKPAVLEVVIDVSSSMNAQAPNGELNLWTVTKNTLGAVMYRLPSDVAMGLAFYPNRTTPANPDPEDPTFCVNQTGNIPIAWLGTPGSLQRLAIFRGLVAIQIPESGWGTPTYDAYSLALRTLLEETSLSVAPDRRYLLLITDGMPTLSQHCIGPGGEGSLVETAPILEQIAAAKAQGIRTFVAGWAGSLASVDVRPWLSAAAMAGGTAMNPDCSHDGPSYCHFDLSTQPDFSQGLQAALRVLDRAMLSCRHSVPPPPTGLQIDKSKVGVFYAESAGDPTSKTYLIAPNDDPDCQYGWHYTDLAQTEIEICGVTCDRIQQSLEARLDLAFACRLPPSHW